MQLIFLWKVTPYGSSQLILQVEGGSMSLPLEVQGIIDKKYKSI